MREEEGGETDRQRQRRSVRMRMTFSLYLPVPPVRGHGPEVLDRRGSVAQDLPNRGEERERGGGGERRREGE